MVAARRAGEVGGGVRMVSLLVSSMASRVDIVASTVSTMKVQFLQTGDGASVYVFLGVYLLG